MKKLFTLLVIIAFTLTTNAQAPSKMSYQAVVRNNSGALVTNQAVGMKISILQGSPTGTVVFSETYNPNPQTNSNGLVTLEIGSGLAMSGSFSAIDWAAGPYFLKTETDPAGGTNYSIVGTSQLSSVPYALHAKTSGDRFSGSYTDLTNRPVLFDGSWANITSKPTTIAGYGITNAMSTTHPANGITSTNISNWNELYSWGPHMGLYIHWGWMPSWHEIYDKPTTLAGYGITDAINISHPVNAITTINISNWNTAYGWGNHTNAGYLILPSQTDNSGKYLTTNGTTVSWGALSPVAITGSYNDLLNKPIIANPPSGNNSGDMMYWNGITWIIIPVGSPGQYLQLSSGNIPTWTGATFCTIVTTNISSITSGSATISGSITDDGGAPVTSRGICYGTISTPTIANDFVTSGLGKGDFIANINGLSPNTTYYVRAFAINSAGIAYGNVLSFPTLASGGFTTVTDIMGNVYNTVAIGTQIWMKENLKTTILNDGTPIPVIEDFYLWRTINIPALCWYNNDSTAYNNIYGPLYNGHVVMTNKLCPTGWHVPTDIEWSTLEKFLGMDQIAADSLYGWRGTDQGTQLRSEVGYNCANGTNSSGFTALPGGMRHPTMFNYGSFNQEGQDAYFWGSTERSSSTLWYRQLSCLVSNVGRADHDKNEGMSVRCLKN